MSSRPSLLFLTPVTPSDRGNGLAMRAGLFLEGLAHSHAVRVLVAPVFGRPAPPGPLLARCAERCDVLELDPHPDQAAELRAGLATPHGRARAQALHPRPALCRMATLAGAQMVADAAEGSVAVHVMRLYLAPWLDVLLEHRPRACLVLDVDDVESDALVDFGPDGAQEAARYRRLEAHYLPQLDGVIVSAAEDAVLLQRRYPGVRAVPVPNAVRVSAGAAPPCTPAHASDLIFVGNLSYRPNIEGARWLIDEVLPRLGPTVTVNLVGSRPAPEVRALARRDWVRVVADVPSVDPWYCGARVAVAPLLSGGGTRIKVLEALAHGRPVVATAVGARGLPLEAGEHSPVAVADDADTFARSCRRLLDDPGLAHRLGEAGQAMIAGRASFERAAERVDAVIRQFMVAR